MGNFKMRGSDLLNSSLRKVATVRGNDILDDRLHKVATIRGNDILNERFQWVATVRGSDIYDEENVRLASLAEVQKTIDQAMGRITVAALWLFFVR